MAEEPAGLELAREICITPYLHREHRLELVRQEHDNAEARRSAGVSWSGLGALGSPAPRTPDEIRVDAEAALARAASFAESPRGRFLRSVRALDQRGYVAQAEKARAAFARGFADPDRPACPAELGAALSALARLDEPAARRACQALAELLWMTLNMAAE